MGPLRPRSTSSSAALAAIKPATPMRSFADLAGQKFVAKKRQHKADQGTSCKVPRLGDLTRDELRADLRTDSQDLRGALNLNFVAKLSTIREQIKTDLKSELKTELAVMRGPPNS